MGWSPLVKHGLSKEKLYRVWIHMKERCKNPNNTRYKHYGGRGITICDEWKEYLPFRTWAFENGYQEGLSLDRINNDGNYCPENCRWVDSFVQNNNFSRNVLIEYHNEIHSLSVWSRLLGIHRNTLDYRIKRGWSIEDAFETKIDVANKSPSIKRNNKGLHNESIQSMG